MVHTPVSTALGLTKPPYLADMVIMSTHVPAPAITGAVVSAPNTVLLALARLRTIAIPMTIVSKDLYVPLCQAVLLRRALT